MLRLFINANKPTAEEFKDAFAKVNRNQQEEWIYGPTKHAAVDSVDITKARYPIAEEDESSEEL